MSAFKTSEQTEAETRGCILLMLWLTLLIALVCGTVLGVVWMVWS